MNNNNDNSVERLEFAKGLREYHHKAIWEKDIARPYFPGLEATFDIFINFSAVQEIEVSRSQIDEYLKYTNGHQRVFHLTDLYAEKLKKYCNEEHAPVTV